MQSVLDVLSKCSKCLPTSCQSDRIQSVLDVLSKCSKCLPTSCQSDRIGLKLFLHWDLL